MLLRIIACLVALQWLLHPLVPSALARDVPRTILGIHDSGVKDAEDANYLYAIAEMPLNHLGLVLETHNARTDMPAIGNRQDVRGVLVWLGDGRDLPFERLVSLAREATTRGIPFVLIGTIPNGRDSGGKPITLSDQNRLLGLIGLQSQGSFVPYSFDLKATVNDAGMVEFERKLPNPPPASEAVVPTVAGAKSYLAYVRNGPEGGAIHAVVLTPKGGYVAEGFSHYESRNGNLLQWYLNPFAFFASAFHTDGMPVADTTTLDGRRLYYSHIDGDGWGNVSTADAYAGKGTLASEVILHDIVDGYPALPVTVAPIAGDLDPAWGGTVTSQQIARALFARANVEPSTHTFTHPFEWKFFGPGYKPENELRFLKKYPKYHLAPGLTPTPPSAPTSALARNYDAPRAYGDIPYNLHREVEGSVAWINSFCPPGKRVRLLQWSGDTSPTEDAVAAVINAGLLNLNGRDTRFDGETPSYTGVSPIGRRSGRYMQISASHANENVYTDLWQGRFFGYRYLKTSLINTETPRRIKPVNLYYHMYSGEKQASLAALKEVLDYASRQDLAPVTATRFAAIGQGFFTARFEDAGPQAWKIRNRGALNTIRFDNAAALDVDAEKSAGIMGSRHRDATLYVSLDPAVETPLVVLHDLTTQPPARPLLVDSRWDISSFRTDGPVTHFHAQGFGPGDMTFRVPGSGPDERWEAQVFGHTILSGPVGPDHSVRFRLPSGAENGADIIIRKSDLRPALL